MSERDERPVTLPLWVVEWLVANAYGEYTVAEAITTDPDIDAEIAIHRALREAKQLPA